jgi:hypothetical protein
MLLFDVLITAFVGHKVELRGQEPLEVQYLILNFAWVPPARGCTKEDSGAGAQEKKTRCEGGARKPAEGCFRALSWRFIVHPATGCSCGCSHFLTGAEATSPPSSILVSL